MTYGQIRLLLTKALPGVDEELISGWIQGRYQRILDTISWKRQEAESILQAPASYAIGTITATQGSSSIVSDGSPATVFTAGMNGLMIRINNTSEYYQFTYVSPTSGTLDRGFEGPTASGLAYRIDQAVFLLPSNCRILRQVRPMHNRSQPLTMVSPAELNRISHSRNLYGTPQYACQTWDSFSDPPQMQVELFPVPDGPDTSGSLLSWGVDYIFEEAELDPDGTTATLKPFARPSAIMMGVHSDAMRPRPQWEGNLAAAALYEADYDKLVQQQLMINAQQRGAKSIQLAPNLRRQTPPRYRKGPFHRGFTG